MLTDFRERGREEEREGEKHRSLASHMRPYWGPNPQRRYVLWLEIKPATFSLQDDAPTNWATLARAEAYCLNVQWNVAKFIYMHTYRVVCLFCIVISHLYFFQGLIQHITECLPIPGPGYKDNTFMYQVKLLLCAKHRHIIWVYSHPTRKDFTFLFIDCLGGVRKTSVCFTYLCTHWLILMPSLGVKPITLAYLDDGLTS